MMEQRNEDTDSSIVYQSASKLKLSPIISLPPNVTLSEAAKAFSQVDAKYALVKSAPEIILGILRKDLLLDVLSDQDTMTASVSVATVMDRDFSIEPNSSTVLELLKRFIVGRNQCCIIVNSIGDPVGIVSFHMLVTILKERFASPSEHLNKMP